MFYITHMLDIYKKIYACFLITIIVGTTWSLGPCYWSVALRSPASASPGKYTVLALAPIHPIQICILIRSVDHLFSHESLGSSALGIISQEMNLAISTQKQELFEEHDVKSNCALACRRGVQGQGGRRIRPKKVLQLGGREVLSSWPLWLCHAGFFYLYERHAFIK